MNFKEFYLSLPVKDNNVKLLDGIVRGDNSNMINITLVDGDKPFDFTGYSNLELTIEGPRGGIIKSEIMAAEEFNADNPYLVQVASAKDGRISFNINGNACASVGTYFARFTLFADGKILTTARLNYHVCETSSDISVSEFEELSEVSGLKNAMMLLSAYAQAELKRISAETERKENEEERALKEQERQAALSELLALQGNFEALVKSVEEFANAAEVSAEAAKNPTVEAIRRILEEMEIPSDTESLKAILRDLLSKEGVNGNAYDINVKTGTAELLSSIKAGELFLCTDDFNLYIGTGTGNICLTRHYEMSEAAPDNTNILWIGNDSIVRFYKNGAWNEASAKAVFG